jgi:hypothetical protein
VKNTLKNNHNHTPKHLLKKKINLGKLDDFTLIIGITTPLAYMATKAGENFPT